MKTTRIGLPLALLLTVGCSRSNETPVAAAQQGLPPGFELNEFATGLGAARFMAFGPDGTLYVSSIRAGTVLAYLSMMARSGAGCYESQSFTRLFRCGTAVDQTQPPSSA